MIRYLLGGIVALIGFSIGASVGLAQLPSATIRGVVSDNSGAVVPKATLTVRNTQTGLSRTATSAGDGSYSFPALPIGDYEVRAEHSGFQTVNQGGLTLTVAQEVVINFTLPVGTTSQTITVTSAGPLVNTSTPELGGLVNPQKMEDLPLNGRNYINLAILQPGITNDVSKGSTAMTTGTWIVTDGVPPTSNNQLLDGTVVSNLVGGAGDSVLDETLGVDGIQEFRVLSGFYSAEYGYQSGGQVLLVSKSGTNQFHGDAFDYLRNDVLDATYGGNTWFAPPAHQIFRRNQFGGSVGGPIKKDKLFFDLVFESLMAFQPQNESNPTLASGCIGAAGAQVWNGVGTQPIGSIGPCPNLGANPAGPGTNSVKINNVTAGWLSLFHPSGATYTNTTVNGLTCIGCQQSWTFPEPQTEYYGQARMDYSFSAKDSFFVRSTTDMATEPISEDYDPFAEVRASTGEFWTLGETHTFSPAWLMVTHGSFSHTDLTDFLDTTPSGPGITAVTAEAFPQYTISGLNLFGSNNSSDRFDQNIFTGSEDVTYIRGKHTFQFGGTFNRIQQGILSRLDANGAVSFTSIASLLEGEPASISVEVGNAVRNYRNIDAGVYIQDNWRLSPNFTLILGVRYEPWTVPHEIHGLSANLQDPATDTQTTPGPPICCNPSFKDIAPRVGFAWNVFGDGKTSIRGGYSQTYDSNIIVSFDGQVSEQTPFSGSYSFSSPATATPVYQAGFPIAAPPVSDLVKPSIYIAQYNNFHGPQVINYNLAVERQLPGAMALTVAYAGTHSIHLTRTLEVDGYQPLSITNGVPVWPASCTVTPDPCVHINPNFTSLNEEEDNGYAHYNGLQVSVVKSLGRGVEFQSNYTWSKSSDNSMGIAGNESAETNIDPSNPFNPRWDYGPSTWDAEQAWKSNVTYHLPKFGTPNRYVGGFINGWWVSSLVTLQSGLPFSVSLSNNQSNSLVTSGGDVDRPNYVTSSNLAAALVLNPSAVVYNKSSVIQHNPEQWYNPNMFTLPPGGTLGDVGRDAFRGPGYFDWDSSVVKDTKASFLGESGSIQFRAEFFNTTNHANYFGPTEAGQEALTSTGSVSSSAGQITALVNPNAERQIQFALKVIF
jgi:hypothetical protein